MSIKITGVLKDALGKPVAGCTIRLTATKTSATVITTTKGDALPDTAGSYSMDVEPGRYKVSLILPGWPPEIVGYIEVMETSSPGTLNDFLTKPAVEDLTQNVMARFELLAAQVAKDAEQSSKDATAVAASQVAASASEGHAETSETNAAASATAAHTSETNAHTSEQAAAGAATAAKSSETNAGLSASAAADSQSAAHTSEINAKASETASASSETEAAASASAAADSQAAAKSSESHAKNSEDSAAGSKTASGTSETHAAASATAAHTSEINAHASALAAAQSAIDAQGVVAGTGRLIAFKKIEVSGKYVPSPGTQRIIFELAAAGGSDYTQDSRPGTLRTPAASGGYAKVMVESPNIKSEYDIQIGAASLGSNGGDTVVDPVVVVSGGHVSKVVDFDGQIPTEPTLIHAAAAGGGGWRGASAESTFLHYPRASLMLAYLIPGSGIATMYTTGYFCPIGMTPPVININMAALYQYPSGYGAGSPGYNPALTGISEGCRMGRPGVVLIWEYS